MGDPDIDWMADVMVPARKGAKKPTPIAPGDVVKLKSGGPAMTVVEVPPADGQIPASFTFVLDPEAAPCSGCGATQGAGHWPACPIVPAVLAFFEGLFRLHERRCPGSGVSVMPTRGCVRCPECAVGWGALPGARGYEPLEIPEHEPR